MEALIPLLLQNLPGIIAQVRELLHKNNPDGPQPTDAEVKAALLAAIAASLTVDSNWLAAHPQA